MDPTRLKINLRPRTPWEGIDLGFMLARQWFLPLTLLWLITALPLFVIFNLLFRESLLTAAVLTWWCKPVYEPLLVYWLGQRVFGQNPDLRAMIRLCWKVIRPQLLANLTWRRFAAARSFVMPVAVLEGLRGKERGARLQVLTRQQQAAAWLTLIGIHFEMILEIGFLLLLVMMMPQELQWLNMEELMFQPNGWQEWLQQFTGLLAMAVIAPFYVAGGFGLYLTRRGELEAWDVEMALRGLAERVRQKRLASTAARAATSTVLLGLCLLSGWPLERTAIADQLDSEEAKQLIEAVMQEDDFGQRMTINNLEYIGEERDSGWWFDAMGGMFDGLSAGLALAAEVALWTGVAGLIVYLWVWISRHRNLLPGTAGADQAADSTIHSVAGLDIRPQSLPSDIAGSALGLFEADEPRAALSLLYRATLLYWVERRRIEITRGATEGDCLRLARELGQGAALDYFEHLTRAWQHAAYAHRFPDTETAHRLCREWSEVQEGADG